MMLEYLGFYEAADLVYKAIKSVINQRKGTPDIANGFKKIGLEATALTTEQFGDAIVDEIGKL